MSKDKQEFEAWAEHAYGKRALEKSSHIAHDYASPQIEWQWIAWKASRRAESVWACVNALDGVDDPVAELERLREIERAAQKMAAAADMDDFVEAGYEMVRLINKDKD